MNFYIELSSNASYSYNTISNFKNRIQLLHPLDGDWEVGLAEISYTKSWKNLTHACVLSIEEMFQNPKPFISRANLFGYAPFELEDRKGIVRAGYYESVKILCDEISKEMQAFKGEYKTLPQFFVDDVTKQVVIRPGFNNDDHPTLPFLNQDLSEMLGFDRYSIRHPIYNESQLVIPQRPADISGGINTLYVYCNLVVPQYIGDTRAQLLKTVEIPSSSKFGDQVVIKYENPHYVGVLTNDFEHVEIDIKDDTNTEIQFMFGRTRIKLHFRKCQTHT